MYRTVKFIGFACLFIMAAGFITMLGAMFMFKTQLAADATLVIWLAMVVGMSCAIALLFIKAPKGS